MKRIIMAVLVALALVAGVSIQADARSDGSYGYNCSSCHPGRPDQPPPQPTVTLSSIAITGPASVDEGKTGTFTTRATYSDGSSKAVTPSYSVGGTAATISAGGLLTAKEVTGAQSVTVSASYKEGTITKTASKTVAINDMTVTPPPPPVNEAPVASAGPDQTVEAGAMVVIDASASTDKEDGSPTGFEWKQISGETVQLQGANAETAGFSAPDAGGVLEFQVTVKDSDGAASSDTCRVTVNAAPGATKPPVADAGVGRVVYMGQKVQLDGSKSSDPDGSQLAYAWRQTGGVRVQLQNVNTAKPSFTAPRIQGLLAFLHFELTVTDAEGKSAKDGTAVLVIGPKRHPGQPGWGQIKPGDLDEREDREGRYEREDRYERERGDD